MFSTSESEIISSPWALSYQHSQAWIMMVANILQGRNKETVVSAEGSATKEFQKDMRRFVVDPDGNPIYRDQQGSVPEGSIGVVQIAGPMVKYGSFFYWGADELISFAAEFERDPNIIGQIWVLDSGGGSVGAIAPYHEFLKNKTKPVIGLADTCASANYYVGVATDKLYARNNVSAMFGSIGVVATLYDFSEYFKKLGIEEHLIYASQSSYKHKSEREALKGKYASIQKEHLDPIAIQFQEFVKKSRPNLKTDVEGILEGACFYAEDAQAYGMIDGILDFEQAIEQVKFLADARSIMY